MQQSLLENLGIIVGAIIASLTPYITSWLKNKFKKKKITFNDSINYREKINLILAEIRTYVDSDRASIIEYHNGEKSLSGVPFKYSSMTFENTNNSTKEIILSFQKIPISPIISMLKELVISPDGYIGINLEKEHLKDVEHEVYRIHALYGVTTSYTFKLSSNIENGVLVIDWTNNSVELDPEEIEFIKIKILEIQNLYNKLKS